ncbi:MAG: 3'-5' exonuclease, partial [Terriglobia bacterium]
ALQSAAVADNLTLWEAVERLVAAQAIPTRALKAFSSFEGVMRQLMEDQASMTLSEFFKSIFDRTGYLEILEAEDTPESQGRIENLQELVNAAREAEERGETLAGFLDHVALVSDSDEFNERSRVTLMTLHTAKGLEFAMVVLAGMEEGLFPHKLSLSEQAGIEEERRLCYVGMTRAKSRLILTWAGRRRAYGEDSIRGTRPSRFLEEIPTYLRERKTSSKPRTEWRNSLNSVDRIEAFLKRKSSSGAEASRHAESHRWKRGARVRHPKYGLGTVLECEDAGEDSKLTVSFPGHGRKKLIERYASLERLR